MPHEGNGSPLIGTPVQPSTELIIEHCATREYLANDHINYVNQFGTEFEVSAKRYAITQKAQQLENEKTGKFVVDLKVKKVTDQNTWQILLASNADAAKPVDAPEELSYDAETLVNDIRRTLGERGSLTIRGVASLFRRSDNDKSRSLDAGELQNGL